MMDAEAVAASTTTTKLLVALAIFLCGLLSTTSPLFIAGRNEALFSAGNMMACGVLLSAGLVHQLPDSQAAFAANYSGHDDDYENENEEEYPWSTFICGLTFLLFLNLEESVHLLLLAGNQHDDDQNGNDDDYNNNNNYSGQQKAKTTIVDPVHHCCSGGSHHHVGGTGAAVAIPGLEKLIKDEEEKETSPTIMSNYGSTANTVLSHSDRDLHDKTTIATTSTSLHPPPLEKMGVSHSHSISGALPLSPLEPITRGVYTPRRRTSKLLVVIFGEPKETVHHHHNDHILEHLHGSLLASLMLLMALSVHSILAGLSMGLDQNAKEIYSTAIAIIAHKAFAGYALGSTMVAANLGYDRCVIMGTAFACSTPLGVLCGMGLKLSNAGEGTRSIGIVQAVVAGTFLYVAIMEVGMKELLICRHNSSEGHMRVSFSQKQLEAIKLASMLFGYLGMSYLAKFV